MSVKSCEFTAAARGFHVYRDVWLQSVNETMKCFHENGDANDVFAIKCVKGDLTVGHLPREISKPTKYILLRVATVKATITSDRYRKSPLFQGGVEIRCVINFTWLQHSTLIFIASKIRRTC